MTKKSLTTGIAAIAMVFAMSACGEPEYVGEATGKTEKQFVDNLKETWKITSSSDRESICWLFEESPSTAIASFEDGAGPMSLREKNWLTKFFNNACGLGA